jgi:hypothetical protein
MWFRKDMHDTLFQRLLKLNKAEGQVQFEVYASCIFSHSRPQSHFHSVTR